MKILVTGSKGFIGRNLVHALKNQGFKDIFEYDADSRPELLESFCLECDFVFHLAGVNRPEHISEFTRGNSGLTQKLVDFLEKGKHAPVVFSSSIQAELDNPYGRSKRESEEILKRYGSNGRKVYIYRFPNVFGKWCRPDYNSVIATFCYNVAHDLPIRVNDEDREMNLVYIDDVVQELTGCLKEKSDPHGGFCCVSPVYTENLAVIADMIRNFSSYAAELKVPDQSNELMKKLYSTYLSYLPINKFKYPLTVHEDDRGSFTEFLRTEERGQVSVNISRPHIVKGNHWHNTKHEIFLVVSGTGIIRMRRLDDEKIIKIYVSGNKLEPVLIPPGYVHNIENVGEVDMVTVMWANEIFDIEHPDTYGLKV